MRKDQLQQKYRVSKNLIDRSVPLTSDMTGSPLLSAKALSGVLSLSSMVFVSVSEEDTTPFMIISDSRLIFL